MHVCVCVSQVLQNFRRFGERSTVMRATFEDALYHLPDASLDLVYLDGNAHTGQVGVCVCVCVCVCVVAAVAGKCTRT